MNACVIQGDCSEQRSWVTVPQHTEFTPRTHTHPAISLDRNASTGLTLSVTPACLPVLMKTLYWFQAMCHHLERVNHFLKWGSTFSFLLVPANQVADPARVVFCLSPLQCMELSGSLLNGRTSAEALSSIPLHQNLSSECLPDVWTYILFLTYPKLEKARSPCLMC